jgi:hypothetical protein
MKSRPVGAELLHADRQTDRHDAANIRFSQFCERPLQSMFALQQGLLFNVCNE